MPTPTIFGTQSWRPPPYIVTWASSVAGKIQDKLNNEMEHCLNTSVLKNHNELKQFVLK